MRKVNLGLRISLVALNFPSKKYFYKNASFHKKDAWSILYFLSTLSLLHLFAAHSTAAWI